MAVLGLSPADTLDDTPFNKTLELVERVAILLPVCIEDVILEPALYIRLQNISSGWLQGKHGGKRSSLHAFLNDVLNVVKS